MVASLQKRDGSGHQPSALTQPAAPLPSLEAGGGRGVGWKFQSSKHMVSSPDTQIWGGGEAHPEEPSKVIN